MYPFIPRKCDNFSEQKQIIYHVRQTDREDFAQTYHFHSLSISPHQIIGHAKIYSLTMN